MKKLTDQQIKELQDKYLGKRIQIPFTKEMYTGYGVYTETISGICNYLGYNPYFPDWGLQVTLERLPVQNVDHTKIKLLENDSK